MSHTYKFEELQTADLIIDGVYEGGTKGNAGDCPLAKLMRTGNQGGFRSRGLKNYKQLVVLYTDGHDLNWPDKLNPQTGQFVYYGDNRHPGSEIHDKPGNKILRDSFQLIHGGRTQYMNVPPFFVFQKNPTHNSRRSVRFLGLAVPSYPGVSATEDLVAVWKMASGQRFQNYRAVFTILDEAKISRDWITNLISGKSGGNAPTAWKNWIEKGLYSPLVCDGTTLKSRSKEEQLPLEKHAWTVLQTIYRHFSQDPFLFEHFAATVYKMLEPKATIDEITKRAKDGGRDAIGRLRIGIESDPIYAEFSLEAKCYKPPFNDSNANSVGVKEVARLISRIRNRQFGVLVTTSYIAKQAYEEVRDDGHPLIFICGKEIVDILGNYGLVTNDQVKEYLNHHFPV